MKRAKRPLSGHAKREIAERVYAVDEHEGWPEETYCRNVMCRTKFWRQWGEDEFCPACRKMLRKS